MSIQRCILVSAFVIALTACGSGPNEGVFVDSPVQGLSYASESESGVTDAAGIFLFREDEMTRFFLGDIDLGETLGQELVSPFDLVSGAEPITDARELRRVFNNLTMRIEDPFVTVANIAAMLQGLDQDQDPSNGIVLPEGLSELAAGKSVDFARRLFIFPRDIGLNSLIRDGRADGLWTEGPFPVDYVGVLDHLYSTLGLEPELFRQTVSRGDFDGDGTFDNINTEIYNDAGQVERFESDSDGDGTIDSIFHLTYNERNQVESFQIDNNADGVIDEATDNIYDAFGRLVRSETDSNNDGTPDIIEEREYDDLGNEIRSTRDNDGDGVIDRVQEHEYDANNNQTIFRVDVDGDGTFESETETFFDDNFNVIGTARDDGLDGTINSTSTRVVDANGREIRSENDFDADGTPDIITEREYDALGREIAVNFDSNGDGTVDRITTSTYDELGNEILFERDDGADGTVDRRTTRTVNDEGYITRSETDSDGDGTIDSVFENEYEPGNWFFFFERLFS